MWVTYWIKKAACITKGQWEDPASVCLHRTLFRHSNTPILQDTIMSRTWIHTHNLRAVGDLPMAAQGRTGALMDWDPLMLFLHPWATHLLHRALTARLSTVTCILPGPQSCSRRRTTFLSHSFLPKENGAARTSGWAKLRRRLPRVRTSS